MNWQNIQCLMTSDYCELGLWSRPDAMIGAPQGFSGLHKKCKWFLLLHFLTFKSTIKWTRWNKHGYEVLKFWCHSQSILCLVGPKTGGLRVKLIVVWNPGSATYLLCNPEKVISCLCLKLFINKIWILMPYWQMVSSFKDHIYKTSWTISGT